MTSITFVSKLTIDGSLQVPDGAVNELGLHPGDLLQVKIETSPSSEEQLETSQSAINMLTEAVEAMIQRTPAQIAQARDRALERYKPRRTPPPGRTLSDMVSGKWPGNETDEQIDIALEELS